MNEQFVANLLRPLDKHPVTVVLQNFSLNADDWTFTVINISTHMVTLRGTSDINEACLDVSVNVTEYKVAQSTFTNYVPK